MGFGSNEGQDDPQFQNKVTNKNDVSCRKTEKQERRNNLFEYHEHIPSEKVAASNPSSKWFDFDSQTEDKIAVRKEYRIPDWYEHNENLPLISSYIPKTDTNFLSFDSLYSWQRRISPKLPPFPERMKPKNQDESKKISTLVLPKIFPRGGIKKAEEKGDMYNLLAYTYQRDFIKKSNETNAESKRKKLEEKRMMKEKLKTERMDYCRNKKKDALAITKPLFKLSKFEKVPACVDSHRV